MTCSELDAESNHTWGDRAFGESNIIPPPPAQVGPDILLVRATGLPGDAEGNNGSSNGTTGDGMPGMPETGFVKGVFGCSLAIKWHGDCKALAAEPPEEVGDKRPPPSERTGKSSRHAPCWGQAAPTI